MKGVGVLMPVSCLPSGKFSDGYKFVDWLSKNKYDFWQVLPLNPRDHLGSPYNSSDLTAIDKGYGSINEWFDLKRYSNAKGIKIIGDLPFFCSKNSVEVKKFPKYFDLKHTSGTPPDYYAKRGQRWGHPQYNWEELEKDSFKLFIDRFKWAIKVYDFVRLDHFRGYEAVFVYPDKKWVKVPGEKLFSEASKVFKKLPFIAEDLGVITSKVENLRKKFGFLGNRVIQFGISAETDIVYYTSTHDSQTLKGCYGKKSPVYMKKVLCSKAAIKIIPMWDVLGLKNLARLNRPGTKKDNWCLRLDTPFDDLKAEISSLTGADRSNLRRWRQMVLV